MTDTDEEAPTLHPRYTEGICRCGATLVDKDSGYGFTTKFCTGCDKQEYSCTCTENCYCGRLIGWDQDGPFCPDCRQAPYHCTCPADDTLSRSEELRAAVLNSYSLDDLPAPEALIDGILYRDTLAWLHGKPGCGKSFIALDWAGCVSLGLPWQDRVVLDGPVLYVIAEGVTGLRQRVRAWEDHADMRTKVCFLPVAVQFLSAIDLAAIIELARDLRPVFVVIDTQACVTVGADENSARDMGTFVAAADKLRQATAACVLFVHHESRAGENMRGSTALEGAAATLIRVTKDGTQLRLENVKQKDAAPFDPIRLRLAAHQESAVISSHDGLGVTEELNASEEKILTTLRESFGSNGAPASRLLKASALPESSFYRALKRLADLGEVVNIGNKKRTLYVLREDDSQDVLPTTPNDSHGRTTAPTPNSHTL